MAAVDENCTGCGKPALGYATINGKRYCHSEERSCYTKELRRQGRCVVCGHSPEGCTCGMTFAEKLRGIQVNKNSLHPDHIRMKERR